MYHIVVVHPTILMALNDLTTYIKHILQQIFPWNVLLKCEWISYLSPFSTTKPRLYAGDIMQIHVESNTAYLVLPGAHSRTYLSQCWNITGKLLHFNAPILIQNVPVHLKTQYHHPQQKRNVDSAISQLLHCCNWCMKCLIRIRPETRQNLVITMWDKGI